MASWTCSVCGREHDELPNSLSWGKPYDYFAASDDEKQGFSALDDDRCHLNDERHFLRCTLELPILDTDETLVLGVWIGVSKTNFYQYAEFLVNKTNEPDPPLLYGVLCGVLPGFTAEELLWTEVMIRIRRDGLVPEVVIADPKHALYRAYNHGVSHEYWHLMLRELQPEVAYRDHKGGGSYPDTHSWASSAQMSELNKDSKVECGEHGLVSPSFVCRHLVNWTGTGFNVPDDPPDPDWPFKNAWCDECDKLLMSVGEWNDETEGFADITMICENCYEKRRVARAK